MYLISNHTRREIAKHSFIADAAEPKPNAKNGLISADIANRRDAS